VTLLSFLVEVKNSRRQVVEKLGLVAQIHVLPFSVNVTFNLLNSTSPQTLSKSALTFIPKMQGRFPFVRTGRPDNYWTSYFEIGFFHGFLLKNHLLPVHYLGFD